MDNNTLTIKKLTEVSEDEWKVALEKCYRLINYRVKGRTKAGCHSEHSLGMSPFDFYIKEAIDKLYTGDWEWKEQYSFSEQLCRIVGSLISEKVRKYKVSQKKEDKSLKHEIPLEAVINFLEVDFDESAKAEEKEKIYEAQLDIVLQAIDGNEDMESLMILVMEGKTNDEICEENGWKRKKLYGVTDRMKAKVKTYIAKHSKEVTK